jgi:NAD(P)-dependent dehydrogenase (short-subunit alcohol dehydrogenase family)
MKSLQKNFRALVIGSSGSIGSAFLSALTSHENCAFAGHISRKDNPLFDLTNEVAIEESLLPVKAMGPYELIIDATGALTINGHGPEKSLQTLNASNLSQSLWVNCIGPSILLKNLVPILAKERCIYAKLSARVGSISDNKLGGWYSYRSSKAAFNMMLQTAAIEHKRKNPNSVFVALQPGTVASPLSSPFVDPAGALTPQDSVKQMLSAIDQLAPTVGAHFIDYRGQKIAW